MQQPCVDSDSVLLCRCADFMIVHLRASPYGALHMGSSIYFTLTLTFVPILCVLLYMCRASP